MIPLIQRNYFHNGVDSADTGLNKVSDGKIGGKKMVNSSAVADTRLNTDLILIIKLLPGDFVT